MSRSFLLDTNGWIALLNRSDALHSEAAEVWSRLLSRGSELVVTDWILAETGNGLARIPAARAVFLRSVELFETTPQAHLIEVSSPLRRRALDLYHQRGDKTWGLVDCASFAVMSERGITDALTDDRHFLQAGLRCLLRG